MNSYKKRHLTTTPDEYCDHGAPNTAIDGSDCGLGSQFPFASRHAVGRATVEAQPPKPQHEQTQNCIHWSVHREQVRLLEPVFPGSQEPRRHQSYQKRTKMRQMPSKENSRAKKSERVLMVVFQGGKRYMENPKVPGITADN